MKHVRCQPYYDAWFTHVYVTHGNGEIDLIDGGTAKVYRGQEVVTELVYYNYGVRYKGGSGARLYTKIYRDNELVGASTTTRAHRFKVSSTLGSSLARAVSPYSIPSN